ncbi:MAG: group I intron-associated PD-(D/E)XK endonuclease [Deltaproteobacteria bacterium]
MDTKLKSDIAESAAVTELLKRGFKVLKPFGDRLPYDLGIDQNGQFLRIQVKSAWFDKTKNMFCVDARRTKTNRRRMLRARYDAKDFDFAMLYVEPLNVFYIVPCAIFNRFSSTICLVESKKRQRKPMSAHYRERWSLLSKGSSTGNG